jgi:hypothetical protein
MLQGDGPMGNETLAIRYARKGCEMDHAESCFVLSGLLEGTLEASQLVERACELGLVVSCAELGREVEAQQENVFFIEQYLDKHDNSADDIDVALPCPSKSALKMLGPIKWPADSLDQRWGTGVTQFSEIESSQARPIEVCSDEFLVWFSAIQCPNGAPVFQNSNQIHEARKGNLGPGGRCGMIIDEYEISCQTESKIVYVDMYHCSE